MEIPFHKTHITENEIDAVAKTMRSGWLTMGPQTIKFENEFAKYIGVKHAISLNSATAALHLSLKAIGLKRGDEVIISTFTFIANAEVVTYFGAKPVLCDIVEGTNNIDVSKIEDLITARTKVIMPVHFGGQPCDMDEINVIAKKYNIEIIEDAAHALPSKYKQNIIGTISNLTCFSFYATKTLATGEGGMVTTNNDNLAKNIKINRLHGIRQDAWDRYTKKGSWFYEVVDNGNKYNTTDINSSIGLEQLKKIDWMNDRRFEIAKQYMDAFDKANIETTYVKEDRQTSWHLFSIYVKERDNFIEKLKKNGVGTSVHFIPVHMHPYYKNKYNYIYEDYPVSNSVFNRIVSLPIYPGLSDKEIKYIIDTVIKYYK